MNRPTLRLSSGGGPGETLHIIAPFLANDACAEQRSCCPLEPVLGSLFFYGFDFLDL